MNQMLFVEMFLQQPFLFNQLCYQLYDLHWCLPCLFHSAENAEVHSAVTTDKVTYRQIIINKKQENSNMTGKADLLHLHHGLFLQPDTLIYIWVSRSIHYVYFVGSMLTFPSKHEADGNIIIFIGS